MIKITFLKDRPRFKQVRLHMSMRSNRNNVTNDSVKYVSNVLYCVSGYSEPKIISFQISVFICLIQLGYVPVTLVHWLTPLGFPSFSFCIDVSTNQVKFKIQEEWNEKYLDPTTDEYVKLKQQIVEEVNELI